MNATATVQTELLPLLMRLDDLRTQKAILDKQEKTLAETVVQLMRAGRVDELDLPNERRGVLVQAVSTIVDPDEFEALCKRISIKPGLVAKALTRSVSLPEARKLLGADQIKDISSSKKGKHTVRIVSASRKSS